jgi:predicted Zn-dependent protease
MTRDGTFLIEGGKIRKAVKNMRFTDSFIRTLREVELSRERKLLAEGGGYDLRLVTSVLAPYMKLKKLKFTSSTEF